MRVVAFRTHGLLACIVLLGCSGSITGGANAGPGSGAARAGKDTRGHGESDPNDPGSAGPGAGDSAGSGARDDGAGAAADDPADGLVDGTPAGPSAAPLRRLSSREYMNTVRDLFAGVDIPAQTFPPPAPVAGFENNELSLPATSLLVESELSAASAIAQQVVAGRDKWASCTGSEDLACAQDVAAELLPRAYRRPPTAEE